MRPKTDQLGRDTTVVITSQRDINVCPVKKLKEYLLERGSYSGPLFCHLFANKSLDMGNLTSLLGLDLLKPSSIFTIANFCVTSSKLLSLLKELMPATYDLTVV
jgi:hypothetical protein